mgnify:CR=1 FL=1
MSEENNILIQEYSKNPINNFHMQDFTIKQHEGNFICWDDITIYLKIDNDTIKDYSFDWNCSTITTAAASLLAELIIWKKTEEILNRWYSFLNQNWLEVSKKRKRAAVIALLAARNAIHEYNKEEKRDSFDDLIDN